MDIGLMSLQVSASSYGLDAEFARIAKDAENIKAVLQASLSGNIGAGAGTAEIAGAAKEAQALAGQLKEAEAAAAQMKAARDIGAQIRTGLNGAKDAALGTGKWLQGMAGDMNGLVKTLTAGKVDFAGTFAPLIPVVKSMGLLVGASAKAAFYLGDLKVGSLETFKAMYRGIDTFSRAMNGRSLFGNIKTGLGALPDMGRSLWGKMFAGGESSGMLAGLKTSLAGLFDFRHSELLGPALGSRLMGGIQGAMASVRGLGGSLWGKLFSGAPDAAAGGGMFAGLKAQFAELRSLQLPNLGAMPAVQALGDLVRGVLQGSVFSGISSAFGRVREGAGAFFGRLFSGDALTAVRGWSASIYQGIAGAFGRVRSLGASTWGILGDAFGSVRDVASSAFAGISGIAGRAFEGLKGAASGLAETFGSIFSGIPHIAGAAMGAFATFAGSLIKTVGAVVGALGELGVAAVGALRAIADFGMGTVREVYEIVKMSKLFGVGVEDMQRFTAAAHIAGVGQDDLNDGLMHFGRHMGDLREQVESGTGPLIEHMRRIGIEGAGLDKFLGSDLRSQLLQVADSIKAMPNEAERISAQFHLIGRHAMAMTPILQRGSESIREMEQLGAELGAVMPTHQAMEVANAMSLAKEAGGTLWATMKGFANEAAIALAPLIKEVSESIRDGLKAAAPFIAEIRQHFGAALQAIIGQWREWISAVGQGRPAFEVIGEIVRGLAAGFPALVSSAMAVARAVGGIIGAFVGQTGIDNAMTEWDGGFKNLADSVKQTVETVADGIRALMSMAIDGIVKTIEVFDSVAAGFEKVKGWIDFADKARAITNPASVITDQVGFGDTIAALGAIANPAGAAIDLFRSMGTTAETAATSATTATGGLVDQLHEVQRALNAVGSTAQTAFTIPQSVFDNIGQGLGGALASIQEQGLGSWFSGLTGGVGDLWDTLKAAKDTQEAGSAAGMGKDLKTAEGMEEGSQAAIKTINAALVMPESTETLEARRLQENKEVLKEVRGILERIAERLGGPGEVARAASAAALSIPPT